MAFLSGRFSKTGRAERKYTKALEFDQEGASEKELLKAKSLYESAAKKGHVEAIYNLSRLYQYGQGVEKNETEAIKVLELGVAQNDASSMSALGLLYVQEESLLDGVKAKDLFIRAIEAGGYSYAATYLASLYFHGGKGLQPDLSRSQEIFESHIKENNYEHLYYYIFMLVTDENLRDPQRAFEICNACPEKQREWLTDLLYHGDDGVECDKKEALRHYQIAFESDDERIIVDYGTLFHFGDKELGIPKDESKAKQIYLKAIERNWFLGKCFPLFNLGFLYEIGSHSVPRDVEKAQELYKEAAEYYKRELYDLFGYLVNHDCKDFFDEDQWTRQKLETIAEVLSRSGRFSFISGLCFENENNAFPKNDELARIFFENSVKTGYVCAKVKLKQYTLTRAWMDALSNPQLVNKEYILKYIRSENITTPSAFICGHNLLLMALRKSIINESNINEFENDAWYFRENLYGPATQLVSGNEAIIYPIWQHAERIGILIDGYVYRILHEVQLDINKSMNNIYTILDNLSAHVKKHEDNIDSLATYLTQLEEGMKQQSRNEVYATLAKCALSLIPIVGNSLGEIINFSVQLGLEIAQEDIIGLGVDMAGTLIDEVASVDLSNIEVIERVFSDDGLSKLDEDVRSTVLASVQQSSFKEISNLQHMLQAEIEKCKTDNINLYRMNHLSSPFNKANNSISSVKSNQNAQSSVSNPDTSQDLSAVQEYESLFNFGSGETISIDNALEGINHLQRKDGLRRTTPDEFDDLFLHHAEPDAIAVNKLALNRIIGFLRTGAEGDSKKGIKQVELRCRNYYRENTKGSGGLRFRLAERAMMVFIKNLGDEGLIDSSHVISKENVNELFEKIDDGDRKINEDEFTAAVIELVQKESESKHAAVSSNIEI